MQSDSNFRTGECSILLIEIWYCRAFLQNCRNMDNHYWSAGIFLLNWRTLLTELLTVKLFLLSFRSVGLFSLNYHILRYLHRTVGLILDERSIEHFLENTHFAGKTENSQWKNSYHFFLWRYLCAGQLFFGTLRNANLMWPSYPLEVSTKYTVEYSGVTNEWPTSHVSNKINMKMSETTCVCHNSSHIDDIII